MLVLGFQLIHASLSVRAQTASCPAALTPSVTIQETQHTAQPSARAEKHVCSSPQMSKEEY